MGPESDAVNGDAHSPRCYGGNICGGPPRPPSTNNDYRPVRVHLHAHGAAPPARRAASPSRCSTRGSTPARTRPSRPVTPSTTAAGPLHTDFQMYDSRHHPARHDRQPAMTPAQCGWTGSTRQRGPELGPLAARGQRRQRHLQEQLGHALHHQQPRPRRHLRDAGARPTTRSTARPRAPARTGTRCRPCGSGGSGSGLPALGLRRHGDLQQHRPAARPPSTSPTWASSTRARRSTSTSGTPATWGQAPPAASRWSRRTRAAPPCPATGEQLRRRLHLAAHGGNGFGGTPSAHPARARPARRTAPSRAPPSGTSHFNGLWLHIRAHIPSTYTCTDAGWPALPGCWWKHQLQCSPARWRDRSPTTPPGP